MEIVVNITNRTKFNHGELRKLHIKDSKNSYLTYYTQRLGVDVGVMAGYTWHLAKSEVLNLK